MKIKNIIIGILVLIFLAPVILAISIDIDMKDSFTLGEEISFSYTILSEEAQEIEYIASVNCPNAPLPLLEIKTVNLEANIPFIETYIYMSSVSDNTEPQTCEAGIGILSPEEILESKSFTIITNPSFEFNVLTCKDLDCAEQTKVFILNKDIYFDYTSEISDANIIATLTYPDKITQQLTLPTSIKANQIGNYELEATASKAGYKIITKKIRFGIIEQEAEINYVDISQKEEKESKVNWYFLYFFIAVIVFLIVIISINLFKKIKRQRKFGKVKGLEKNLKKGLKKKEKIIKKKERKLLGGLFRRKKKLPLEKKQELNKKIQREKKILTREKVEMRKEFSKRLRKEGKILKKKEKKIIGGEKIEEVGSLLTKGRMQLASGNNLGAKNTYGKIRRLHDSLKPDEKNREVYNQLLRFHERLTKLEKKRK